VFGISQTIRVQGFESSTRVNMGIDIQSAQSSGMLLPVLAARLKEPQADPFALDIVVVPGVGISDWIQERLSIHLGPQGIVANTKFWLPSEFNRAASAFSTETVEAHGASQMQWAIFEYLTAQDREGSEPAPGFRMAKRRLSFAGRVADLFDRYSVHRPEMINDWNAGKDTDGTDQLSDNQLWQPKLWREVKKILATPTANTSFQLDLRLAAELQDARLTFFGLESFSRAKVDLLRKLGIERDIQILHLTPVNGLVKLLRAQEFIVGLKRRDEDLTLRVQNPLLRSWGRSALECAALLSTVASNTSDHPREVSHSVLGSLQGSLAADSQGADDSLSGELLEQSDGTVQIHLCHGATRQVEVMRDALLQILKSDDSIRLRDVLILCPDIDKYSPLLEPLMGAALGEYGQRLSVSIVDKSNVTASPVAVALDALLTLASGRCAVAEVLETMSLDPIRLKFELDEEDLMLISGWTGSLNVLWGLDAEYRTRWSYPDSHEDGTWQLAIDRLSAGVLLQSKSVEEHFPGVAAHDDVSGAHIETIGKLFSFHKALRSLREKVAADHTAREWAEILKSISQDFLKVLKEDEERLIEVAAVVGKLESNALLSETAEFSLSEFQSFTMESLPSIRGSASKWADVIRVATPNRLRGVSARVIAVLGLDEDAFRGNASGVDDILVRDPRLGDRDMRSDERLGLLTMIHAASEYLVITCNGNDITNNKSVPLAVPVEELKDAIELAISNIPKETRGNRPVVISHSRQLADPVNVGMGPTSKQKNVHKLLGSNAAWTFDRSAVDVVNQIAAVRAGLKADSSGFGYPVLSDPEESEFQNEVSLQDLFDALRRPTDVFITQRLGIMLPRDENVKESELPLWPNPLSYSEVGRELLDAVQEGDEPDTWKKRKHLLGGLPLGVLAESVWSEVEGEVAGIFGAGNAILSVEPISVAINYSLQDIEVEAGSGDTLRISDQVTVHGSTVLAMHFSTWGRRMRLLPWIRLAALTACDPAKEWSAVVIAKAPKVTSKAKNPPPSMPFMSEEFVLAGDTPEERLASAMKVLQFAKEVRARALRVPIPLFERSSWLLDQSNTEQKKELAYDLQRPANELVFGEKTMEVLKSERIISVIDLGLPNTSSRFEGYAGWLNEMWKNTVRVTKDPEPAKSVKPKGKKSVSENSTLEVGE